MFSVLFRFQEVVAGLHFTRFTSVTKLTLVVANTRFACAQRVFGCSMVVADLFVSPTQLYISYPFFSKVTYGSIFTCNLYSANVTPCVWP